ncbi:hypothetical protein [Streptomyces decoyicus]
MWAGIGQLVEALASEQLTAAQRAERLAADREVVRRMTGVDLRDEEFEQAPDALGNLYKIAQRSPGRQGHRGVIILDTSAVRALASGHKTLNLLVGNVAKTPGKRLSTPRPVPYAGRSR